MTKYKIMESTTPATEKQLNKYSADGWDSQEILNFNNKLYYHFVHQKYTF